MKLALWNGQPEIFYTIQGEGVSLGQPSIFVRLSLCNLHCIWCDTDYTWNWEGTSFVHRRDQEADYHKYRKEKQLVEYSTPQILPYLLQYPCLRVVLTGGEPLLQQRELVELMQALRAENANYFFEVETNGTIQPSNDFEALINQYNVSPKLANSGNPPGLRERPAVLQYFAKHSKAYFKFVVAERDDLQEIMQLMGNHSLPKERILLMPEGTKPESLAARRSWLIEVCKTHGFRYTDRLHIHVYGEKRGV